MPKGMKTRVKQSLLKQRKSKKTKGARSNADRVLTQGVGRSVAKAFGAASIPKPLALSNGCWDAFDSRHAPLPRSVGPYTVIRTSALLTTKAKFIMVGTSRVNSPRGNFWSNICVAETAGMGPIASSAATKFQVVKAPGGNADDRHNSTFTCCPAAISCQVMGKTNLQNADGQLAAAVVPARMDLYDDARDWEAVGQDVVSFFRPRLLSAGKLSLRGIQMDSHPLSMSDVSEFLPLENTAESVTPGSGWTGQDQPHFLGWAPMCVYNPQEADLSLLVSVEWRVRFDLNNPAVSSHSHHGVTTDAAWDQHVRRAHSVLPGVLDIVEKVANTGMAVSQMARFAGLL